jgi:hypothetical protein
MTLVDESQFIMDDTLRLQDRKYNEGFDEEQVFEDKQVL